MNWSQDTVNLLRHHPGEWLVIKIMDNARSASAIAHQIKTGKYNAFRYGRFKATTRKREDGKTEIIARYDSD